MQDLDKARQDTENLLLAILDSSLSGIMAFKSIRDEGGNIIDFEWILANRISQSITGRTEEQLLGSRLLKIMPGNKEEGLFDIYKMVVTTGNPATVEKKYAHDGMDLWFKIAATRLNDGFVVTFDDITKRKNAEIQLREKNASLENANSELQKTKERLNEVNRTLDIKVIERTNELITLNERFNLIGLVTNDVIWEWEIDNNKLTWNEGFKTSFGYSEEEIEPTIEAWYNRIHPEDRNRVVEHIQSAIKKGENSWSDEYRFLKKDGSVAHIHDRSLALKDSNEKVYRMVGSMMDITTLKKTEEELRKSNNELTTVLQEFQFVTDNMPQLVWVTKADGYHDYFNQRWYEYTGQSYEQAKNKGWAMVLHPDDFQRTLEKWQESLHTGKHYEIEYRFRRFDGEFRWFLGRALPLRGSEGNILKWFGTCTDIHDLKVAREELIKINNDLDNFIYTASHDLKAPITNLEGLSNMLKKFDTKPEMTQPIFTMMDKSINRFKATIHDLTEITKVQHADDHNVKISLYDVVTEIENELDHLIISTSATIIKDFSELETISFSKKNMRSLMYNLISNALKFRRPEVNPVIEIKSEKEAAGKFSIYVKDNGLGIKEKDKEKVFGMFKRLHGDIEGTGVGMYIVKRILENNNGKIDIQSKVDEGTTFKLTFETPIGG
jgi:two-component system, chemotaxis family, CheB/CheR fusion protein